jgi:hypothetical protein
MVLFRAITSPTALMFATGRLTVTEPKKWLFKIELVTNIFYQTNT